MRRRKALPFSPARNCGCAFIGDKPYCVQLFAAAQRGQKDRLSFFFAKRAARFAGLEAWIGNWTLWANDLRMQRKP